MSPLRRRRRDRSAAPPPTLPGPPGPDGTPWSGGPVPPVAAPPVTTGIRVIDAALDRAVAIPSAAIHRHVDQMRRKNPHASPTQIVRLLEKEYLLAISASGGAVGAAAATPAVGTGVSLALTAGEVATFFMASSAFALGVADVHGIGIEETARRRTLLLATVLGEQGAATVAAETGLGTAAWARAVLLRMPTATIKRVNTALTRRFVRTQATRQGALAFGRLAPFGIGAVVGVAGARALGSAVITGAERAFGPPPAVFPRLVGDDTPRLPAEPYAPDAAPWPGLPTQGHQGRIDPPGDGWPTPR